MTQTPNFQLNQWSGDDYVRRTDFNADNAKIDAALAAAGNCRIVTGSYTGTGTYGYANKNSLTLPFSPVLLLISGGSNGFAVIPMGGESGAAYFGTTKATWKVTRDGNTVSWYMNGGNHSNGSTLSASADGQMNTSGTTYYYAALGTAEE